MKNLTILLLLTAYFTNPSFTQTKTEPIGIVNVDALQFGELINEKVGLLVDVRTSREYAAGNIKGSKLITVDGNFGKKIQDLDKDVPVLVYCRSGKRSFNAARILQSNGFKTIYNLKGGFNTWQRNKMK